jgi:chromosome segregation ATPase
MAASFLNIGMHTLQSSKTSLAGAGNDVDDFIKLSAYSEKINELSLKLSVQTDAHSQLKGTLSQLQNEIDAIQLMIFSNDRKLSAAETNLYTSTNSLSYYEALYVELTESNKILIPQLPALKSKVDTLAAALKTALADADDAISKKNNSIASLDNSIIKRDKDYDAVAYSNFFSSA